MGPYPLWYPGRQVRQFDDEPPTERLTASASLGDTGAHRSWKGYEESIGGDYYWDGGGCAVNRVVVRDDDVHAQRRRSALPTELARSTDTTGSRLLFVVVQGTE